MVSRPLAIYIDLDGSTKKITKNRWQNVKTQTWNNNTLRFKIKKKQIKTVDNDNDNKVNRTMKKEGNVVVNQKKINLGNRKNRIKHSYIILKIPSFIHLRKKSIEKYSFRFICAHSLKNTKRDRLVASNGVSKNQKRKMRSRRSRWERQRQRQADRECV